MAESGEVRLIERAFARGDRTAILDLRGSHSYRDLLAASGLAAARLLEGRKDLGEARVAFLVPSSFDYAVVQWGIWRAGGLAVPLCVQHPRPELEYVVDDSRASILVADAEFAGKLRPIAEARKLRFVTTQELLRGSGASLPQVSPSRRAMMLYTSGTTSKPKGVVTTHRNIEAQVISLVTAWEWSTSDHTLLVLPLHHIHGVINILACALWSGAVCEMLPQFDAQEVWRRIAAGNLTSFMAVPTVYAKLISAWESANTDDQRAWSDGCNRLRLMVSGSAALPVQVLERWRQISGHVLLERYGMTEIGMALSNPLNGRRIPGHVGTPLPGVDVRLADEQGNLVEAGTPGEILVRGESVFLEYWNRPEATRQAFCDGWFRTGDVAVLEDGAYRILGRNSVDIIKTGGYKVSALEIEEVLRTHPAILECAVVGLDDPEWGERVCAAIVLREGSRLELLTLRQWGKERMAPYKLPTRLLTVQELPRNAMGKVIKPEVVKLFQQSGC